jgi:hypothetical protein
MAETREHLAFLRICTAMGTDADGDGVAATTDAVIALIRQARIAPSTPNALGGAAGETVEGQLLAEAGKRHKRVVYVDDPRYATPESRTPPREGCACGLVGWPCTSLEYRLAAALALAAAARPGERVVGEAAKGDEGVVVCLRRYDPALRQMVFEPLPNVSAGSGNDDGHGVASGGVAASETPATVPPTDLISRAALRERVKQHHSQRAGVQFLDALRLIDAAPAVAASTTATQDAGRDGCDSCPREDDCRGRCGAFVASSGERCIRENDHEGRHVFDSDTQDAARWRAVRVGGRVYQTENTITTTSGELCGPGRIADSYADEYADALVERQAKKAERRELIDEAIWHELGEAAAPTVTEPTAEGGE